MAELESVVKPMLTVLCSGQPATVTQAAMRVIAFWAVKTATVCAYSMRGRRGVDEEMRQWLFSARKTLQPPNHAPVWIASYQADTDTSIHLVKLFPRYLELHDPKRPEFSASAFDFTAAIGKLALKVIILPSSLWKHTAVVEFQEPKSVVELWPNSDSDLSWPLPTAHTEEDLARLSFAMVGNQIALGQ